MVRIVTDRGQINADRWLTLNVRPSEGNPHDVIGEWSLSEDRQSFNTEPNLPIDKAFFDALALCQRVAIPVLWVRDIFGLFPKEKWPDHEVGTP